MVKRYQKKKSARGKRKKSNINKVTTFDNWSIYLSNIRNVDARKTSFNFNLSNDPSLLVILKETHFKFGRKGEIPG